MMLRRKLIKSFGRMFSTTSRCHGRQQLVIVGTGWGGYSMLTTINKQLFDAIVVSPRNHFIFTPLLTSTTVGTLEFRSIIEPIRNANYFRNEGHYHMANALSINPATRTVTCQNTVDANMKKYSINYDYLVIAVGAQPNTFNVPGVKENAFFLKEIEHARKIRHRLLENFELAVSPNITREERDRLHHTVIVGGGPTGVEFGAELYDFIRKDVSRLYSSSKTNVKVTLLESDKILGMFDERLRKYAEKKINQREQFHLRKDAVTEVTPEGVRLASGSFLPCGLVVWSTGLAPQHLTQSLDFPKNKQGQILTDDYLAVKGDESKRIFAIGDCADLENLPLPCTAQVAERQGWYLASQLNGKTKTKFEFTSMGSLCYIGGYKAVADLSGVNLKDRGFTSWVVWRSAYLTKLGSWKLRLQVPMDWLKTLLLGRDTSKF